LTRHPPFIVFTVLAAVIALLAFYLRSTGGEVQEHRYASYGEAQEGQARGWLPPLLPKSATEIHEWHDLDTSLSVGSFRFDTSERSKIVAGLQGGVRRRSDLEERFLWLVWKHTTRRATSKGESWRPSAQPD
jgi:hypothetical protein